MHLRSLSLEHFRNYHTLAIEFGGSDLHLFVGPNGSGKTNLLESIALLSLIESCRGMDDLYLRQWNAGYYRVQACIAADDGQAQVFEVVSQMEPRKAKVCSINDVRMGASSMVGRLPVIIFLPEELGLFTGPPAGRRRFLDMILSEVSPEYYAALHQYQKVLRQRGALLRSVAEGSSQSVELSVWDRELALLAATLTVARLELLSFFELALAAEVRALGETMRRVHMHYERKGGGREVAPLAAEIEGLLLAARARDILLQSTSVGPHRDDFWIEADGHALASSASRGQQRLCVLALLLVESSFLALRRGEQPVILLDDIFSELDASHQERVLSALSGHQVLLTATQMPAGLRGAKVWEVEEGIVRSGKAHSLIR